MSSATAHRFGARTTALLVVASMIGTGVFTSGGVLLEDVGSIPVALAVWLVGGMVAMAGALSYAELAAYAPASGGEYALLSRTVHPAAGFVAGVISIVAGFAAPIAACGLAFASYLDAAFPGIFPRVPTALAVVVAMSVAHGGTVRSSARVQDVTTLAKVALIALFLLGGALLGTPSRLVSAPAEVAPLTALLSPAFALGLVQVYFAYTGWNAAAYVAGEVDEPARTLPRALALGTGFVTLLYVALNAVFFSAAPAEALHGQVAIGAIAAEHLFGPTAGRVLALVIAAGLVSTIGALVVTGTRVYDALGRDYARLGMLARRNARGAPIAALGLQCALAATMVGWGDFAALLDTVGFTLSIGSALTVCGLFVARWREPGRELPYRVPLYPWTPLFFVLVAIWTVVWAIAIAPSVAIAGAATIALGLVGYALARA